MRPLFASALLACTVTACTKDGDDSSATDDTAPAVTYDLTVTGTGYTPHDGAAYEIAVLDGTTVLDSQSGTQSGDTFSASFTSIVEAGNSYFVHLYFDVDASGGCNSGDHMWSYNTPEITGDTTLTENHNTDFTDVCSTFGD